MHRPLHLYLQLLAAAAGACRDRFQWPFSTASVWNSPIGTGAVLTPARIYAAMPASAGCALRAGAAMSLRSLCAGWNTSWDPTTCLAAGCCYDPHPDPDPHGIPWCHMPAGAPPAWGFHADIDYAVRANTGDAPVDWVDQGDWNPGDHCVVTGPVAARVPLPDSFATPCGGGNNAMALLLPDNRTLLQMQPAFRRGPGGPLLALYHRGGPVPFPWQVDILSDGAWGAHGGSGLSSIGGTIRAGELLPGAPPLRHALKLELLAHDYYFSNGTTAPYAECFRWPALGCDGYAHDTASALAYNGSLAGLQPGALLALPDAAAVAVRTVPGGRIREALAAYGGYLVDDTASDSGAICMEAAVADELAAAYGIEMAPAVRPGVNAATTAFYEDLLAIFRALAVVANNDEGSVGGGGEPLAPLAPDICT